MQAFDEPEDPYLPDEVLFRQKEQFSDGVGYDWVDGLKAHAAKVGRAVEVCIGNQAGQCCPPLLPGVSQPQAVAAASVPTPHSACLPRSALLPAPPCCVCLPGRL